MQEQFLGILPLMYLENYYKRAQILINQLELINLKEDEREHNVTVLWTVESYT